MLLYAHSSLEPGLHGKSPLRERSRFGVLSCSVQGSNDKDALLYARTFPSSNLLLLFHRHMICLFFLFALISSITKVQSVEIEEIKLGNQLRSSTVGAPTKLVQSLNNKGTSGQKIFRIPLNSSSPLNEVKFSTCSSANFDTYLVLLDAHPLKSKEFKILDEVDNDRSCVNDMRRSSLEVRVPPGIYFLLVTGNNGEEGSFTLQVGDKSLPTPTPLPWSLDRVDQRNLPLDGHYSVKARGDGVWVYVIDSGIRLTHKEFEGRVRNGYDFVDSDDDANDCTGHGTHVAATIGGKNFGVAKGVNLVAVRVLDCENNGRISDVLNALEWVLIDIKIQGRLPAVVSLSINTQKSNSLNAAMTTMNEAGVPVVVPAGDRHSESCNFSPSSSSSSLTVGATDSQDSMSRFSSFGQCTDLFGPGENITSAWHTGDFAARNESGTAHAASLVTGTVGILLSVNEGLLPKQLFAIITSIGTLNIVSNAPVNDPTRLVYVRSIPEVPKDVPGKGKIFIYFVLQFSKINSCLETSKLETIRAKLANALDIGNKMLSQLCVKDDQPSGENNRKITFQIEEDERLSIKVFEHISESLLDKKDITEDAIKEKFLVDEEPWVVDSSGNVYWAAPEFEESPASSELSAGKIAAVVVGISGLITVIIAITYILYRRHTKVDAIESMEGSADIEPGPVVFKNPSGDNPASHGPRRSFRAFGRAVNPQRETERATSIYGNGNGMNSFMGSFLGSLFSSRKQPAAGVVRMQSFGGEALASIETQSRSNSFYQNRNEESFDVNRGDQHIPSFRGGFNAVTILEAPRTSQEKPEEIRLQSVGREALISAVDQGEVADSIDETPRYPTQQFPGSPREQLGSTLSNASLKELLGYPATTTTNNAELTGETPRIEALANRSNSNPREQSFFGMRGREHADRNDE